MEAELLVEDEHVKAIKAALGAQHALHGLFADVLQDLGGKDFVLQWAADNPSRFLNLLVKMTPNLLPTSSSETHCGWVWARSRQNCSTSVKSR